MKQSEKLAYIARIVRRLPIPAYRAEQPLGREMEATRIFRASRRMLAASIAGSQQRKKSQAELDRIYARAFPAMLVAIK